MNKTKFRREVKMGKIRIIAMRRKESQKGQILS